jgi:tetraacyldisaccharide 4'-kinase
MKGAAMIPWQRIWNDDEAIRRFSPTGAILYLASLPYRLIVSQRNRLYDGQILKSAKLARPVISIGNITVGGTGKTPCVIYLAQMLGRLGYRPAVLSRGYGGKNPQPVNIVSDGRTIFLDAKQAGDEPLLIARTLPGVPVLTGARRSLTGQAAIERFGAQVLICDDAFQHRQIRRDINIVLLDAQRPFGNGHLLPRGGLREPLSGLRRADCLMLTRDEQSRTLHPEIERLASGGIPVFRAVHRLREIVIPSKNEHLAPGALAGKKVCAFSGIARPESFRRVLQEAGADILSFIDFPDHHPYNRSDLKFLEDSFCPLGADFCLTTEKDAVRLAAWPDFYKLIAYVRIEMQIMPAATAFEDFIVGRLEGKIKT